MYLIFIGHFNNIVSVPITMSIYWRILYHSVSSLPEHYDFTMKTSSAKNKTNH